MLVSLLLSVDDNRVHFEKPVEEVDLMEEDQDDNGLSHPMKHGASPGLITSGILPAKEVLDKYLTNVGDGEILIAIAEDQPGTFDGAELEYCFDMSMSACKGIAYHKFQGCHFAGC